MASTIRQTALNEMRETWNALEVRQGEFRLAAIWQGAPRLQYSRIEKTFKTAARQAFESLKILHEVKQKYQFNPVWMKEDPELQGGSLAGLRDVFVKAVNTRIHQINKIYATAVAALFPVYQEG